MKKIHNSLSKLITTAIVALILGVAFKVGLSIYNFNANNGNLIVYAQPNLPPLLPNENKAPPTPSVVQQSQYLPETQSQNSQGIKVTVSNFYVEENHVFVDVCYDLPGKDVWDINTATLEYDGNSTGNFAVNETSIDLALDKPQNGIRCLRLDFYDIQSNSDLSTLTLTIGNLGQIAPMEGRECEGYLARINTNEKIKESEIEVTCEQSPSSAEVKVKNKPDDLSEEEVNALIAEAMFNQVSGNWVFTVTQNK